MSLVVLFRPAFESILKSRNRAVLTMLGIVIGVAAVIVVVAVGSGARSRIREQIDSLGTNMIVITPGARTSGGVSQGSQAFATLTVADAEKIRREAQTVVAISPVIVGRSQVFAQGGNWRTMTNGVDTDDQTIRGWETDAGGFFGPEDVRASRSVAVLGRTVAERLFAGSDPVGQEIQVAALRFKVMGILAAKGQTACGSDSDDVILVRYATAATGLTGRPRIPQILSSTASEGEILLAQDEIRTIMRESHRIGEDEEDDFTVRNRTDLAAAAESSTRVMTLLVAAIASISLLVGSIGIMNVMLESVTERTREIGIRPAIGACSSDVLIQFLVESVVMGGVGGVAGLVVGFTGAKVLAHLAGWETVISPLVMIVAVGFSGAVGVLFGHAPARKAAALDPIEALRYE